MVKLLAKISFSKKSALAQNIIRLRKALGWSQEELARKSGVNLNSIKLIETDKSEGRKGSREAIAGALGCSYEDLFLAPAPAEPNHLETETLAFSLAGAVLTHLADISAGRRQAVLSSLFEDSPEVLAELSGLLKSAR